MFDKYMCMLEDRNATASPPAAADLAGPTCRTVKLKESELGAFEKTKQPNNWLRFWAVSRAILSARPEFSTMQDCIFSEF
ncbi:MAG: hypothetical protein H0X25_03345 [Acidobacteriales bacterium]|nr:hypothetical protein [Terriglobales bacterium]